MTPIDIESKSQELIEIIKTKYVRSDGLLSRTYPPTDRTLFDNLDDLVPFFIYFNECDFLLSQIHTIKKNGESMQTLCSSEGMLHSRNLDEWFGGLFAIWQATQDNKCYELLKESLDFVLEYLIDDDFFAGAFNLSNDKASGYYEPWSSGLLEVFCEMRNLFPEAFEIAQKIMRSWISDDYFQQYGIFPYRMYNAKKQRFYQKEILTRCTPWEFSAEPGSLKFAFANGLGGIRSNIIRRFRFAKSTGWYSQLMKSNSTCASAILEFYRATEEQFWLDTLRQWCKNAIDLFSDEGQVHMEYHPIPGYTKNPSVTPAFILADVFCDCAYWIPEFRGYLPSVKEILDYQWQTCLPNGLVPFQEGGNYAHIDSQIDLSISFRRYAELSEDPSFTKKSIMLIEQTLKEHYSPEGYLAYSGEVKANTISPKYNALLLKGMIHLITIDQFIYPDLYDLFKDR